MSDKNWTLLREHLLTSYGELVKVLTRRLHSRERAEDALQDTYEKLERGRGEIAVLQSPHGYLLRMATRIALDRARSEHRYVPVPDTNKTGDSPDGARHPGPRILTVLEGDDFIHRMDDAPDPERIVAGRSELRRLADIVNELPSRRREIFVAAWVEDLSYQEIARKFGLSLRSVQHELLLARQYCLSRFKGRG